MIIGATAIRFRPWGVQVEATQYMPGPSSYNKPINEAYTMQLISSWWTGWRIDTFTFPEMRLVKRQMLGWRRKHAIDAWHRKIAIYQAVKALQMEELA